MRLKKLEALRGFAAFYVVLHHSLPHSYVMFGINLGNFVRFGQEAVMLFFLLSGFVINYSFRKSKEKTFKLYFLKRFSRIYIPLIIIMAVGYIIESVRIGGFANPEVQSLLLNLFMLQDISSLKPNVIVNPYMHNSPLWSLSYEWWFYMLFFPVLYFLESENRQAILIYALAIISALIYCLYPYFIPRLLMYASIWWTGVYLSNKYISGSSMGFAELKIPLLALLIISSILGLNTIIFILSNKSVAVGVHPFLEFRHHIFALLVIIFAIIWKKFEWVGFSKIFHPFLFLAPMSYVIYISHHYFVVDAKYLDFMNNEMVQWIFYMVNLVAISWLIEVALYPKLQRALLNITNAYTRTK